MLCRVALEALRESGSLSPSWLCLCPRAPRGSAPDRPTLCCSDVLARPIFKPQEPQLSPENEARLPPLQCAAAVRVVCRHVPGCEAARGDSDLSQPR